MDHKKNCTTLGNRPKIEVSDIFRSFRDILDPLPSIHAKVVRDILNCRTKVLGGHKLECNSCGHQEYSYNSCRSRYCPKCQYLARAKWVEERLGELLPVSYFHMVFTIPCELRSIALCNKKIIYNILFRAMSETLKEVAERKLRAKIGFTSVLHTWGQNLMDHPHIHVLVPAGGLNLDKTRWIKGRQNYFLPQKILSKVFRGKFLSELEKVYGQLRFPSRITVAYENPKEFKRLLITVAKKKWVVYAKPPFAGPKQVINYLGNYTHRIAISNQRIVKIKGGIVSFRYRDYKDESKNKVMKLSGKEFMRRFLLHVLPRRFVRLRHYGYLASRNKNNNLDLCRKLLNAKKVEPVKNHDWKDFLERLIGHKIDQCPKCKSGQLIEIGQLPNLLQKWKNSS